MSLHAPVLKPTNEKLCSRPAPSQNLNGKVGSGPAGPLLTRGTPNGGKESWGHGRSSPPEVGRPLLLPIPILLRALAILLVLKRFLNF